ncbi:hypothetical protein V1477_006287 [Vespula maculifrons]|uniref:Uncharacterized protein n=1 Tax=Vespula maculifrons TaxID=7453 RepID=A0ABD2CK09_VESMC
MGVEGLLLVLSGREKYGRRGRDEPFPMTPVRFSKVLQFRRKKLLKKNRARRALSNSLGRVFLPAMVPDKKIVKEKCFFPLFPLNRYKSAPIGPTWRKKYGRRGRDEPFPVTRSARRALSNNPGRVLVRALVSEKKIVKEKCFFPLFPLNCYNSAPIGPIWTRKIWA